MRGLDSWLTREQSDPLMDPHAPWELVWLSVEGDHSLDEIEGLAGSWAVEYGTEGDGAAVVIGSYEDAVEARRRCNARYAYDEARDCGPHGFCRVCGDAHGELPDDPEWDDHLRECAAQDESDARRHTLGLDDD